MRKLLTAILAPPVIGLLLASCSDQTPRDLRSIRGPGAGALEAACVVDGGEICREVYRQYADLTPPANQNVLYAGQFDQRGMDFVLQLPDETLLSGGCCWQVNSGAGPSGGVSHVPDLSPTDADYLRRNGYCHAQADRSAAPHSSAPAAGKKVRATEASALCKKFYSSCWKRGWLDRYERFASRTGSAPGGELIEYWANEMSLADGRKIYLTCSARDAGSVYFSGAGRLVSRPPPPDIAQGAISGAAKPRTDAPLTLHLLGTLRCDQFTQPLVVGWL